MLRADGRSFSCIILPLLEPLHTGAGVASVSTSVFVYGNCHHTWKHIIVDVEILVLENSMQ